MSEARHAASKFGRDSQSTHRYRVSLPPVFPCFIGPVDHTKSLKFKSNFDQQALRSCRKEEELDQ